MADFSDPVADLRRRVELAKADTDPAARDQALVELEGELAAAGASFDSADLRDLLGLVRTYRGDARLQLEGAS